MCGISGVFGRGWQRAQLEAMVHAQTHRGPDASGIHCFADGIAGLGHNRLSIIDLTEGGSQPRSDPGRRFWITFNGEIYNYLELKRELAQEYPFETQSDTEVLLAAYLKWGSGCLDRLIGMFGFVIWDAVDKVAFGARDRFGVKPIHYHVDSNDVLWLASEIKAIHAAGIPKVPDPQRWATYLVSGRHDDADDTFWKGIRQIPAGSYFTWSRQQGIQIREWYDVADRVLRLGLDARPGETVLDELQSLLQDSVRLRFRSDVPVGVCLSGGLDSSLLLGVVDLVQGRDCAAEAFTFYCDDPNYDELPWVDHMLEGSKHPSRRCLLTAAEVPALAAEVQRVQDEPFGGFPTLGMAKVHQRARECGVVVLLDGNGIDEAWAGYEYYRRAESVELSKAPVQGAKESPTRPGCLEPSFAGLGAPFKLPRELPTRLQTLQYRDIRFQKIPRAMRFADRVSMLYSRELREPFLDHRIVELGLRQPVDRKIQDSVGKVFPRRVAARLLPKPVHEAPKRPVQTPQREWIRGSLRQWTEGCINRALDGPCGAWFDRGRVQEEWKKYAEGTVDNSFYIWQWISAGLILG